jgi:type I restriction enzyme S subunit
MSEEKYIPKHWQVKKLIDIGEIVSGGTPSTKVSEYWDGNISWISPADLSGYSQKTIQKGRKSITDSGLKNSSSRMMPKGSVLFSSRAPIGYVVIAGNDICTNQGFKSIVPNKSIFNEYLYYFLKASKQEAEKVASGTTFKEISLKAFAQLEIPLPPLKPADQCPLRSPIQSDQAAHIPWWRTTLLTTAATLARTLRATTTT